MICPLTERVNRRRPKPLRALSSLSGYYVSLFVDPNKQANTAFDTGLLLHLEKSDQPFAQGGVLCWQSN